MSTVSLGSASPSKSRAGGCLLLPCGLTIKREDPPNADWIELARSSFLPLAATTRHLPAKIIPALAEPAIHVFSLLLYSRLAIDGLLPYFTEFGNIKRSAKIEKGRVSCCMTGVCAC